MAIPIVGKKLKERIVFTGNHFIFKSNIDLSTGIIVCTDDIGIKSEWLYKRFQNKLLQLYTNDVCLFTRWWVDNYKYRVNKFKGFENLKWEFDINK